MVVKEEELALAVLVRQHRRAVGIAVCQAADQADYPPQTADIKHRAVHDTLLFVRSVPGAQHGPRMVLLLWLLRE